ncbi:MAG: hypothetical protein WCA46_12020 [Actinocatenispora sp.]
MRRLIASAALVLLAPTLVPAAALASEGGPSPSSGGTPAHRHGRERIGIQLLEIPANRRDDPRAFVYIVDHVSPATRSDGGSGW